LEVKITYKISYAYCSLFASMSSGISTKSHQKNMLDFFLNNLIISRSPNFFFSFSLQETSSLPTRVQTDLIGGSN